MIYSTRMSTLRTASLVLASPHTSTTANRCSATARIAHTFADPLTRKQQLQTMHPHYLQSIICESNFCTGICNATVGLIEKFLLTVEM